MMSSSKNIIQAMERKKKKEKESKESCTRITKHGGQQQEVLVCLLKANLKNRRIFFPSLILS